MALNIKPLFLNVEEQKEIKELEKKREIKRQQRLFIEKIEDEQSAEDAVNYVDFLCGRYDELFVRPKHYSE